MARRSGLTEVNTMGKVSVPDIGTKTKGTSGSLLRTSRLRGMLSQTHCKVNEWAIAFGFK